ncbi:RNA polymerase subunit sigma-24, partial [Jiangella rhizosphaerae]
RRRLRSARTPARPAASAARRADLVREFKQAWEAKDIEALVGLLDPQAVAIADGGGLATAHLEPLEGAEAIARALVEIAEGVPGLTALERTVNGQPGLVLQEDGVTGTVLAFDVADDRITRVWAVRNPEKLRPWTS